MSVSLCTATQQPYAIGVVNNATTLQGGTGYPGSTPADSCRKFAAASARNFTTATEHECVISTNATKYPVIKLCEPTTPAPFVLSVADGVALSALIVSVWVSALIFRGFIKAVKNSDSE